MIQKKKNYSTNSDVELQEANYLVQKKKIENTNPNNTKLIKFPFSGSISI